MSSTVENMYNKMTLCVFAAYGYEGFLVTIETDLRRGIPGTEIIGLPDSAIKEARERVRAAIKNSQLEYPSNRLLINLTPAGMKKEGAGFDLAIALAILHASGQIPYSSSAQQHTGKILVFGELELSGKVRGVSGILSALATITHQDVDTVIVPLENYEEANAIIPGGFWLVSTLNEAVLALASFLRGEKPQNQKYENLLSNTSVIKNSLSTNNHRYHPNEYLSEIDMKDIKGQPFLKRAIEIAIAGRHNIFIFGPPGCGKSLCCHAISSIIPNLESNACLETSRVYSVKGILNNGLITRPPFRCPHHSSSTAGMIGGGKFIMPGEISLAHNGILFLDEAPEFKKEVLQSLREPLESKRITLARAGKSVWFPSNFQLIMASNVCPCGSLGHNDKTCLCSPRQINHYWRRIGSAILDRIDIRLPIKPVKPELLLGDQEEEESASIHQRIKSAMQLQSKRFKDFSFSHNSCISPKYIKDFCELSPNTEKAYLQAIKQLNLSSRAGHSILRVARTIADLENSTEITPDHTFEAVSYRRYGDHDLYWTEI